MRMSRFWLLRLFFGFSVMWEQAISEVRKGNVERACKLFGSIFSKRQGNDWATDPAFLRKKLQKSRKTYGFTAFSGGPDRIRTDDPHNANVMRSQLRYRPIFGYFVYFCSICLCSLLFWPGPCYVALALPTALQAQFLLLWWWQIPNSSIIISNFLEM